MASDVFFISNMIVDGNEDLKSLRMAAAKHQADALLVVTGAAQVDRYINGWGWSYALILPTFFVPGSQVDTLFLSSAALWDVKNEYLYLTNDAEDVVHETPAFCSLLASTPTKPLPPLSNKRKSYKSPKSQQTAPSSLFHRH